MSSKEGEGEIIRARILEKDQCDYREYNEEKTMENKANANQVRIIAELALIIMAALREQLN